MITIEDIRAMKTKNGATPYPEYIQDGIVYAFLRMTDGYGIARDYKVENKCPKCGAKFVKLGEDHGCYDGEWTWTDNFTCENDCCLMFRDVRP